MAAPGRGYEAGTIVPVLPEGIEERVAKAREGYLGSSQFKHWVFTPQQLAIIRRTTHERAMSRFPSDVWPANIPAAPPAAVSTDGATDIDMTAATPPPRKRGGTTRGRASETPGSTDVRMSPASGQKRKAASVGADDADMPLQTPSRSAKKQRHMNSGLKPLAVAEEETLKRHWELEIRRVCEQLSFSPYIMATATIFFKRFYLFKTVLDIKPQDIMLPSIFLAIKAEASPFGEVEKLVRKLKGLLKVKDEKYVEHEMLLLMGNRFHLTVYHPFRSLLGLLYRLRQVMVAAKLPNDRVRDVLKAAHARGNELCYQALTTDCPLLYHPGQIAAGALRIALQSSTLPGCPDIPPLEGVDVHQFMQSVFGAGTAAAEQVPRLNKEAKRLEKRRKRCANPAFLKGTEEYNRRMAKKERDRQARKATRVA